MEGEGDEVGMINGDREREREKKKKIWGRKREDHQEQIKKRGKIKEK